jgi:hypothetical protein
MVTVGAGPICPVPLASAARRIELHSMVEWLRE